MTLSYKELRGAHTLIVGDVGSGKTKLTRALLEEAALVEPEIVVLDFAPELRVLQDTKIGGFLVKESIPRVVNNRSNRVMTPRLSAKTPEELVQLACINQKITEKMLTQFIENPRKVLFINDVSIHLQRGNLRNLMRALDKAETAVLNGYLGEYLQPDQGTGISNRERSMMNKLGERMDKVIYLQNPKKGEVVSERS